MNLANMLVSGQIGSHELPLQEESSNASRALWKLVRDCEHNEDQFADLTNKYIEAKLEEKDTSQAHVGVIGYLRGLNQEAVNRGYGDAAKSAMAPDKLHLHYLGEVETHLGTILDMANMFDFSNKSLGVKNDILDFARATAKREYTKQGIDLPDEAFQTVIGDDVMLTCNQRYVGEVFPALVLHQVAVINYNQGKYEFSLE